MRPRYQQQNVAFSALRTFALCPESYRYFISAMVFFLSSVPCFMNIIVRIFNVIQGNGLVNSFRSKINTRFVSYIYDPVQGVADPTTLSDSAMRRYVTQHAFAAKQANVPPRRCKRNLHNSASAPG